MTVIHMDVETRSVVDLNKCGAHVYFDHPSTEVLCVCFAIDDGPVTTWLQGQEPPNFANDSHKENATYIAHNASFERLAWITQLSAKHHWTQIPSLQWWDCTMARAQAMALPGGLDAACKAAGLKVGKDDSGRRVMLQLSRPRSIAADGTVTWWEDAEKFKKLVAYCQQDVEIERKLSNVVAPLSDAERQVWMLDQLINERGVQVDTLAAHGALEVIRKRKKKLDAQMSLVTMEVVTACTQVSRLIRWLREEGVETDALDKAAVEHLLSGDLPKMARVALTLRQQAAKSSTAKVDAILRRAQKDGRVRGNLAYHAAGTGRWGGRGVQMQNLPRTIVPCVERAMDCLMSGDDELVELIVGDPMDVVSQSLRPLVIARAGHILVGADYSAIEARILAWLAQQDDVLDVFKRGEDIYLYQAQRVGHDSRQFGKVVVLALGYGMGDKTFAATAAGYGFELSEERAGVIKNQWREANSYIVDFWHALDRAAMTAMHEVGKARECDICHQVKYAFDGVSLWCQLPSGRRLCYPHASVKERETPWGEMRPAVHYWTTDSRTKKWVETAGYGGLWAENVTQAVARDVMAEAMIAVNPLMPVVLTVHDELLCEVPDDYAAPVETLTRLMCVPPSWALDLPLQAEGWKGARYAKG